MKFFQGSLLLHISVLVTAIFSTDFAFADSVQVQLNVAICNENTMCEPMIGEDSDACPTDCPVTNSGGVIFLTTSSTEAATSSQDEPPQNFFLGRVTVAPLANNAAIKFTTLYPALGIASWGKTPQYEIGSLAQSWYHTVFDIKLDNLDPGTRYYYRVPLLDSRGKKFNIEGQFTTMSTSDIEAPAAPSDFGYAIDGQRIIFRWLNPDAQDFKSVRLVKSTEFYPKDHLEGKVVYEGGGRYAADDTVQHNQLYYYSIFAGDSAGNFSGPAILHVLYKKPQNSFDKASSTVKKIDPLLKDNLPYVFNTISSLSVSHDPNNGSAQDLLQGKSFCTSKFVLLPEIGSRISTVPFEQKRGNVQLYQNGKILKPSFEGEVHVNSSDTISILVNNVDEKIVSNGILAFCVAGASADRRFGYVLTEDKETKIYEGTIENLFGGKRYEFYVSTLSDSEGEIILTRGVLFSEVKRDTRSNFSLGSLASKATEKTFHGLAVLKDNFVKLITGFFQGTISFFGNFIFNK